MVMFWKQFLFLSLNVCFLSAVQFELLGLYSACGNKSNRSKFTMQAQRVSRLVTKEAPNMITKDQQYVSFDVCNNTDQMINITLGILMDPRYLHENTVKDLKSMNKTLVVFIVTYLRTDLFKRFLENMS